VHDAELEMRMGEVQEALDEIEAFEMRLPDIAVSEPKTADKRDKKASRKAAAATNLYTHLRPVCDVRCACWLCLTWCRLMPLTVVVVVERDGSLRMPCSMSTPRYRPSSLSAPSAWMIRER